MCSSDLFPSHDRGENIIRPFLLNEKSEFVKWCKDKNVPFIDDESNNCTDFNRNRIRHNIVPEALKVNPGLKTVVKKMVLKRKDELEQIVDTLTESRDIHEKMAEGEDDVQVTSAKKWKK